jgi:hypothetical protein
MMWLLLIAINSLSIRLCKPAWAGFSLPQLGFLRFRQMTDRPEPPQSDPCDGVDHGVSPQRVQVLANDASAFNWSLHMNRTDDHARTHVDQAQAAGKAFWQELILAPIGERKLLVRLTSLENKLMANEDPAMPRLEFDMDSSTFLKKLTINYPLPFSTDKDGKPKEFVRMDLVYQGWGMCAEFTPLIPFQGGIVKEKSPPNSIPAPMGKEAAPPLFPLTILRW